MAFLKALPSTLALKTYDFFKGGNMALVQIEDTAVEEYQRAFAEIEEKLEAAEKKIAKLENDLNYYKEQVGEKSKIVISRKWHNPEITVEYNYSGVRIHTSSEDYVKSVINHALIESKPTGWRRFVNWNFPDAQRIEAMLIPAVKAVEQEMKQATVNFAPPIMTGE